MDVKAIVKQAQELQRKVEEVQKKISEAEFEGSSGAGMVRATIMGDGRLKSIHIDPLMIIKEEKQVLEDLIVAAVNNAKKTCEDESASSIKSITKDIPLPPGFKL